MAATGFTPISLYYSTTAAAVPTNSNLVNGELGINITDGKLYYKDNAGVVKLLASNSGSSGDVVGPASATDTGVALFDGTTGKLIKNSSSFVQNAAGNVGIGVTPSIWNAGKALELGTSVGNAVVGFAANDLELVSNVYYNSGFKFAGTGYANRLDVGSAAGAFKFFVSTASGTAGNTVSWTQAMTLDAGGKLLVGRTASNAAFDGKLQVEGTSDAYSSLVRYSSSAAGGPVTYLARSKSATLGTNTIVASGDTLGSLVFAGANGTGYSDAAYIQGAVDGTPGASADMPGRLVFATSADGSATPTERMRIDAAGNVGIGVTPSAWSASFKAIQVGATGVFWAGTTAATGTYLGNNFYFDGARKYLTTGAACEYTMATGLHAWSIAPSGTAGATATFTQAMTLNASGNLGIGTSSPTAMLQTVGNSSTPAFKVPNIVEAANTVGSAPAATQTFYVNLGAVQYYTSNAANNWTLNIAFSSSTSLNTAMSVQDSISITMLTTQGSTAYYNSAVQIDGVSVTPKWQGGTAPTSGNASSIDSYTYVIYKTAASTYTVLASQTKFA